jgi:type VI protein secretion system component VasF
MAQEFPESDSPVQSFPAPGPVPPKRSSATTWIIVVVVIILLCCCCLLVAGYLLWQNGDQWFDLTRLMTPFISLA